MLSRAQFDQSFSAWSEAHPLVRDTMVLFDAAEDAPSTITVVWQTPTLELFCRIGHGLFTLIIAVLGGMLASSLALRFGRRGRKES